MNRGYAVTGRGAVYLRDFGGVRIAPGRPFFPHKHKIPADRLAAAAAGGHLASLLASGELIEYVERPPDSPPVYENRTETVKFARRHKLVGPSDPDAGSDFIERLQAEFGSGDALAFRPEGEIARNTEKLINTIDFDGLSDPLEET